jgi:hypothetical protein
MILPPSSAGFLITLISTLKMEAIFSSETSVLLRNILYYSPKDRTLKSYDNFTFHICVLKAIPGLCPGIQTVSGLGFARS